MQEKQFECNKSINSVTLRAYENNIKILILSGFGRFCKHFPYLHKNTKQTMLFYPFLSTNKIPNTHKQISKKIFPVFQTHSSSFPKITCNSEKRMVSYQSNLSVTELILLLHWELILFLQVMSQVCIYMGICECNEIIG